uniref:Tolllike receptor 3 [Tribolium castaneum] n=1 Tax=Lepeophtheirus salmonis TaxID=72036 RepID=A0A0K2UHV1_LEPSM
MDTLALNMKLSKVVPSALLRLLLILSILLEESLQSTNCPIDSAHCNCMPNEASFVIWCPSTVNHNFQITIKPRILGISCNANKELSSDAFLNELKKLNLSSLGPIDELYFQHCTIPNFSFSAITSALSISSVKEMHLLYNTFEEGQMFIEGQFSGVSSDLERIEIKTPSFKGSNRNVISPNMFDGVRGQLKFIAILTNAAEVIPEELFRSMSALEILSIGEHMLKELSPNLLNDLLSLKRFYFNSRVLNEVPPELLMKNKALQHIEFGISNLTSRVTKSLFENLLELETLKVKGNFLQRGSPYMFSSNTKLRTIHWNNYFPCRGCNNGYKVEVPSFAKGSLSLKELDIQWNRKYDMIVQDDFLEGCKGLEKISIHKTGLRALPQNIFRNARKLKFLDLSGNAMEDTSELLFIGLTNLQKLSLHTNKLTKVTNKLFSDQRSLISLDLSNNQINNIQDFAFHFMSRLQKLNLRNNVLEFKESEPNWESLSQLKRIDLSYNKIQSTNFNIQMRLVLLSLEEINLSNNLIGPTLSKEYLKFHQNNITINLRDNQIKEMEPFPLHENQNINIYLSGNPIDCNCKSLEFHQWTKRSFSERTVHIPDIDRLMCASPLNLKDRVFLDVPSNQLTCPFPSVHIPNVFCPCMQCQYIPFTKTIHLNCSNSELTQFPERVPSPIKETLWISLDMSNNHLIGTLQTLESLFYVQNLTELYLSHNQITSISHQLPANMRLLHLDNNRLEITNEEVSALINAPELVEVSLSNNSFPCNCHSESLYRLLKTNDNPNLEIIDASQVVLRDCNIQGKEKDILISQFADEEEFCLELNSLVIIYVLPAILVLVFILGFVILSLIYKEKIHIFLYQYPVFRQYFIRNDESKNPYDVFISYSHEDSDYVEGKLVDGLESPQDDPLLKYKCLLAIRDFVPGEVISEQIVQAVDKSSRTIIVLSEAFLRSDWAQYEFEIAHSRRKVILLKIGDLPSKEDIGPSIMNYISQNTYLDHDHPNFWRNIRYALPHKGNSKSWRPTWLKPRKMVNQLHLMETPNSTPVPPFNDKIENTYRNTDNLKHNTSCLPV